MSENNYDLQKYQTLDFFDKVKLTRELIVNYSKKHNGMVYISFSGGLDSTVLLHIARKAIPEMTAVFSDTGLEYPEIRDFVSTFDNVVTVKPRKKFYQVIKEYGYPVVSKDVSKAISRYRNTKSEVQKELRLRGGINPTSGKMQRAGVIPKKYHYLIDAPFKISDRCCDYLKKEPLDRYEKSSKMHRILGIMADESNMRQRQAYEFGPETEKYLAPMIFWTRDNVLQYIRFMALPYCKVYGDIVDLPEGGLKTTGEYRTGCMFCMFGIQREIDANRGNPSFENRYQRMKRTHPKQYRFSIEDLGCGEVLDFMGVKY